MSYSAVDPIIEAWTRAHSLTLFTSVAGQERRFCYTSSSKGECYQVSIEPPRDTEVIVHAWSIETMDDVEMHEEWKSTVANLRPTLEAALARIHEWMTRLQPPT
jgi:hypothetical protein